MRPSNPVVPTCRFAPSPNGRLHIGHALSAMVGHELARSLDGRFLVRIEDIDAARSRPDLIDGIFEDLAWLGLDWVKPVLRQSERFPVYRDAARRLQAMGLLYPCFATRAEIAASLRPGHPLDPDGAPLYPGLHKDLTSAEFASRRDRGEPYALRIDLTKALALARGKTGGKTLSYLALDENEGRTNIVIHPERWGDAVIVRKDVPASYHLACVVDDAHQGITHVTRGVDLLPATDLHVLLQVLLGLPTPLYHHHRLLTDEDGRKLSKSAGDISLASLRAAGVAPADIRRRIGVVVSLRVSNVD